MQALVHFAQRVNERTVIGPVLQRHVRISAAVKRGKLLAKLLEAGDQRVNAAQHGIGALGGGHIGKERIQQVVGLRFQRVALALGGHVHHERELLHGLRGHDCVGVVQHFCDGVAHGWNCERHGLYGRGQPVVKWIRCCCAFFGAFFGAFFCTQCQCGRRRPYVDAFNWQVFGHSLEPEINVDDFVVGRGGEFNHVFPVF